MDLYVRTSPPVAEVIAGHEWLRTLTCWLLTPIVYAVVYPIPSALLGLALACLAFRRFRARRRALAPT